ncbi:hypothetical protein [Bradyrhizobium prioriisuperbiae]|uniref:hypothetical protein n=1 Tax=Bradyrhizobium prioriisuperbiae TaxID=2854389 RepID=UPI0028E6D442|nr:hypothetical protein [Bradyrhizobium prioritasuperba]
MSRTSMSEVAARGGGQCSATPRRFSPDMKKRWLPTIDGKVVTDSRFPFSGFATRSEAIEAARTSRQNTNGEKKCRV